MSIGPIAIFDKSALQALSVDQAALFGQFYRTVITPLFFSETMADLEKEVGAGKTPEEVVGLIAYKTANLTPDPSAHHARLMIANLLGRDTVMDGRPHVVGGRPVESGGRRGIVYDEAPEAEALRRWQDGRFLEVERNFAKGWREGLRRQRIRRIDVTGLPRPRDLAGVKRLAERLIGSPGGPAFLGALNTIRVPRGPRGLIFLRWLDQGAPRITEFAPYAAYVATVQLFFRLAISFDMISDQRPSNALDIAYLYYLPFCMVFTSSDRLHAKTVPLFLRADQVFLPGADLKADLKRLDEYFSAQPQEVLEEGMIHFELPAGDDYLTTRLWNQFLPGWSKRRGQKKDVNLTKEAEAKLVDEIWQTLRSPEAPSFDPDDAQFIALQRIYPAKMGKWRILSERVERESHEFERKQRNEPK